MPTIPWLAVNATLESSPLPQSSLSNILLLAPIVPSERWSSIIGIVTAIIGNILISFALNTQRYAHVRLQRAGAEQPNESDQASKKSYGTVQKEIAEERSKVNAQAKDEIIPDEVDIDEQDETSALIPQIQPPSSASEDEESPDEKTEEAPAQKNYLKSPWWWLGLILMSIGEGGNFLAYGFAPASIVSPLGVVALISNCMIAPFMLKERFRWRDALGVIIAVGGTATVALSAEGSNPRLGPDEILALIKRWEPLTYIGITSSAIIVLAFLSNKYGHRTILIDIGLVALFGGYTVLSTKGIASLLTNGLYKVVTYPISYPFVAVLVFTAVMQIKYINRALQHFNSTQVIPTQFVMFTISVVLGSAILYRDFERTTSAKIGQFFGGVALTFLGVWFITGGRSDDSSDGSTDAAAEEGRITLIDDEEVFDSDDTSDKRPATAPPTTSQSKSSRPQPSHPLAQSTTDITSYITTAATLSPSPNPTTKTPPRPEAKPRTTSTPLFPNQNYTLLQPPRPINSQTPPASPSPRRPVGPSRRPLSDALSPGTVIRQDPLAHSNAQTDISASTGMTTAAGSGSRPQNQHQISSRHVSLVERMLTLPTPGPLMSPLSGGLSAVVANDLRRGVGEQDGYFLSPGSSMRVRSRSRRRRASNLGAMTVDGAGEGDAERSHG